MHAVTEDGSLIAASASGSQLEPYASGARKAIWVVGAQKVVPDLKAALRRIRAYSLPREWRRVNEANGQYRAGACGQDRACRPDAPEPIRNTGPVRESRTCDLRASWVSPSCSRSPHIGRSGRRTLNLRTDRADALHIQAPGVQCMSAIPAPDIPAG